MNVHRLAVGNGEVLVGQFAIDVYIVDDASERGRLRWDMALHGKLRQYRNAVSSKSSVSKLSVQWELCVTDTDVFRWPSRRAPCSFPAFHRRHSFAPHHRVTPCASHPLNSPFQCRLLSCKFPSSHYDTGNRHKREGMVSCGRRLRATKPSHTNGDVGSGPAAKWRPRAGKGDVKRDSEIERLAGRGWGWVRRLERRSWSRVK